MSVDHEDLTFLQLVNSKLQEGLSLPQVAEDMKMPAATLYSRIDRMGYELETDRRLVPKKPAPDLDPAA